MRKVKSRFLKYVKGLEPRGIQTTIMFSFSVISISIMLILGIVLYLRFSNATRQETIQSTRRLLEQTGENLEEYLISMRQISDAAYYNVIKDAKNSVVNISTSKTVARARDPFFDNFFNF